MISSLRLVYSGFGSSGRLSNTAAGLALRLSELSPSQLREVQITYKRRDEALELNKYLPDLFRNTPQAVMPQQEGLVALRSVSGVTVVLPGSTD